MKQIKGTFITAALAAVFLSGAVWAGDQDGDGVPDAQDACPYTQPDVQVDVLGCGLDGDGDGVIDARDLCPGIPQQMAADETGCPQPLVRKVFYGVYAAGRVHLSEPERREYVRRLKQWLMQVQALAAENRILVKVATDRVGCQADNLKLAWMRAMDFRQLLMAAGVPPERIWMLGLGERYPLSDEVMQAHDRRVILEVRSAASPLPEGAAQQIPQAVKRHRRTPGQCPQADWR